MASERKYAFTWDLIGDIPTGRPNLGPTTRLEVYRLMQYCFRDVIEQHVGTAKTHEIFFDAGKLAGGQFYDHLLTQTKSLDAFVADLQKLLKELGIGILRVEEADMARGTLVLTVAEDLDCSGLPDLGEQVCTYDEGFIAGLLERFTGKKFKVKEIDCWCTGGRTCRFTAEAEA